jgi:tetratricopeptide (TPR) repeat protein
MSSSEGLPDKIFQAVVSLSEDGNLRLEANDPQGAIDCWRTALELLPQPRSMWESATWLFASIGEAEQIAGNDASALAAFVEASYCDGGAANAFVQMSLGALLLDLGREDEAIDPLLRAYMLEGQEIFQNFGIQYLTPLLTRNLVP